jgi:hypothetical protein
MYPFVRSPFRKVIFKEHHKGKEDFSFPQYLLQFFGMMNGIEPLSSGPSMDRRLAN